MCHIIKIFLILSLFKTNLIATENSKNSCENLSVDYEENEFLTQREQLDLMDSALLKSIENFDECIANTNKKTKSNSIKAVDNNNVRESKNARESNEVRGTSINNAQYKNDGFEQSFSADIEESMKSESVNQESVSNDNLIMSNEVSEVSGSNGKIPDDIPLDDNDDVLARQIKNAALNEADPEKQKKLWDEYRKYKNLKIN